MALWSALAHLAAEMAPCCHAQNSFQPPLVGTRPLWHSRLTFNPGGACLCRQHTPSRWSSSQRRAVLVLQRVFIPFASATRQGRCRDCAGIRLLAQQMCPRPAPRLLHSASQEDGQCRHELLGLVRRDDSPRARHPGSHYIFSALVSIVASICSLEPSPIMRYTAGCLPDAVPQQRPRARPAKAQGGSRAHSMATTCSGASPALSSDSPFSGETAGAECALRSGRRDRCGRLRRAMR